MNVENKDDPPRSSKNNKAHYNGILESRWHKCVTMPTSEIPGESALVVLLAAGEHSKALCAVQGGIIKCGHSPRYGRFRRSWRFSCRRFLSLHRRGPHRRKS